MAHCYQLDENVNIVHIPVDRNSNVDGLPA